jgi:hypothetical protein
MSTMQSNDIPILKQVQVILQGILSLTAIIYSVGFVIVNSNYASYGVTDYQLIQTRYISAGLSYFFIHVGIASMIAIIFIVLDVRKRLLWALAFIIIWLLFGVAIYLRHGSILASALVGASAGVITLIGYEIWTIWINSNDQWLNVMPKSSKTLFIGIGVVIIFCISALAWGRSFWPLMNSGLGGGRPNEAIFVFDTEKIPNEGMPFIPMQSYSTTKQLPILFDNSTEFVILARADSNMVIAVRISKSIILSVYYAPSKAFGTTQKLPPLPSSTNVPGKYN